MVYTSIFYTLIPRPVEAQGVINELAPEFLASLQGIIVVTRVPECAVRAGILPAIEFLDVTRCLNES
jgi:hypothetical protein